MSRTYHKLYVHLIFVTKYRDHLITKELESHLYDFLKNKCDSLDLHVYEINGMPDHVHLLLGFLPTQSMSEISKLLKGSSAHYMNEMTGNRGIFTWKRGFAAFTVSKQDRYRVINYIKNQKEHHKKNTMDLDHEPEQ